MEKKKGKTTNTKVKIIKKKNKEIKKKTIDLNKIWGILFFLIFGWIFSICLMDANYKLNPLAVIAGMIVLIITSVFLYKKLSVRFKNMSNKSTWIFYGIMVAVMITFQGIIAYYLRLNPGYDLGNVVQSAKEMLEYGHSTTMSSYYIQAPNNILITLMIAASMRFFWLFHMTDDIVAMSVANIILIQIAVFFLFDLARRVYNNFTACFVLVLMLLFLPIYPYTTLMYTDTTSMFLPIGFLWLIERLNSLNTKKSMIIISLIIGLFTFISLNLKVTALIVLIAYVIHELIDKNIKKLATIGLIALCSFSILEVGYTTYIKKTGVIGIDYKYTKEIPFTHFIMMGMYKSGAFDAEEWQFTLKLPDRETRKKEHIKVIKRRLNNYGPQGYIKFLNNKVKGQTWGTGTYDFEYNVDTFPVEINEFHDYFLATGKNFNIVYYYCQYYHFTMLFLILVSTFFSIYKNDKNRYASIGRLSIFGILVFLLIWETRSRYLLNFIPVLIFVMLNGIIRLSENSNAIKEKLFYKD